MEKIHSPQWVSNIVVVPKPDGDSRLCLDFPAVNTAIITHRYPLPTIEELCKFFDGRRKFTKIDLNAG